MVLGFYYHFTSAVYLHTVDEWFNNRSFTTELWMVVWLEWYHLDLFILFVLFPYFTVVHLFDLFLWQENKKNNWKKAGKDFNIHCDCQFRIWDDIRCGTSKIRCFWYSLPRKYFPPYFCCGPLLGHSKIQVSFHHPCHSGWGYYFCNGWTPDSL